VYNPQVRRAPRSPSSTGSTSPETPRSLETRTWSSRTRSTNSTRRPPAT